MLDPSTHAGSASFDARVEVHKTFDIRARYPLELALRLDRLTEALCARGGRVLAVARGHAAAGAYGARVSYCLPLLPARVSAKHGSPRPLDLT
jgi:hypothetical protein